MESIHCGIPCCFQQSYPQAKRYKLEKILLTLESHAFIWHA